MDNSLRNIFETHSGRLIHKLDHYIEVYEKYFSKYRNTYVVILEIGVAHGGSLQVWKKYFGDKAKIYAVDINPECKTLEEENVKIFIGSQEDKTFLSGLLKQMPRPDIIIDDGGHTMKQQITTFEILYPFVKEDGIYLCEDTLTSYVYEYGGGLKRKGTFVEYAKGLIDHLYTWHFKSRRLKVDDFTRSTNAIHFYDSMVFFEKKSRQEPLNRQIGQKSIHHNEDPMASKRSIYHQIIKKIRSFGS
jgi:hypothetical protein